MTEEPGKRQHRAAATADQLLQAARAVFESRGYQGTTVGAITEAANTAHGTFYLYFKNKEEAFAKVMVPVAEAMYGHARAPWRGDQREMLVTGIRGFLEGFRLHRGLWRCLIEGMRQSTAVESMWVEMRRPFVEGIERNLARLLAAGRIRPMDVSVAANALGCMLEWFAFTHLAMDQPPTDEVSIEAAAATLADLWFHSVYTDGGHVLALGDAAVARS